MVKFKSFLPKFTKKFPIQKSNIKNFTWFQRALEDYSKHKHSIHTSKCPGIISICSTGWIQYSYQDFIIETNGDLNNFQWFSEINQRKESKYGDLLSDYISFFPPKQLEKFKPFPENVLHTLIKIQSPWIVEIPKGYRLLFMPIPYNDETRFVAATGLVKNKSWLNVQLFWNRINSKEIIKKGTPLCQYVLIKDNSVDYIIENATQKDAQYLRNRGK